MTASIRATRGEAADSVRLAAGEVHGLRRHGKFAKPARVDVRKTGQVDDNVKMPGFDQGIDRVAQGNEFALVRADDKPPGQMKHAYGTRRPKRNVHDV